MTRAGRAGNATGPASACVRLFLCPCGTSMDWPSRSEPSGRRAGPTLLRSASLRGTTEDTRSIVPAAARVDAGGYLDRAPVGDILPVRVHCRSLAQAGSATRRLVRASPAQISLAAQWQILAFPPSSRPARQGP